MTDIRTTISFAPSPTLGRIFGLMLDDPDMRAKLMPVVRGDASHDTVTEVVGQMGYYIGWSLAFPARFGFGMPRDQQPVRIPFYAINTTTQEPTVAITAPKGCQIIVKIWAVGFHGEFSRDHSVVMFTAGDSQLSLNVPRPPGDVNLLMVEVAPDQEQEPLRSNDPFAPAFTELTHNGSTLKQQEHVNDSDLPQAATGPEGPLNVATVSPESN